jgi:hypothetical protein
VKLFTLGRDSWLVCAAEDMGFSGSQTVLADVPVVIPNDAMDSERFQILNDALEDTYELTGQALLDWVTACWREAGGEACQLPAYIGFADDDESLDLRTLRWVEDAARQPS